MLPRQHRLPANLRLRHPTTFRTPFVTIKIAKNNLSFNRYGFIIRKAIEKRATHRNRIRRVFRSCIEGLLDKIAPGYDMLFLFEKGIIDKSRESLLHDIQKLFKEKNLYHESNNT